MIPIEKEFIESTRYDPLSCQEAWEQVYQEPSYPWHVIQMPFGRPIVCSTFSERSFAYPFYSGACKAARDGDSVYFLYGTQIVLKMESLPPRLLLSKFIELVVLVQKRHGIEPLKAGILSHHWLTAANQLIDLESGLVPDVSKGEPS